MSGIKSKDTLSGDGDGPDTLSTPDQAQLQARAQLQDQREQQQLEKRLQQNEAAGANVMQFDPEATPEEKANQARKLMADKGFSSRKQKEEGGGLGMASDIGGKTIQPTINLSDVDRTSKSEGQSGDGLNATGATQAGSKTSTIPEYYEVGWTGVSKAIMEGAGYRQRKFHPDGTEVQPDPGFETRLISRYLTDQYYGMFWWNGAVIIVAILSTYFATRFGGGIFSMLVIGAFCTTYYNASMRRTRQRARDDISRELSKQHMASEHETAEWINHFMSRFWMIYEPVLSATVISTVDAILVQQCPSFLDSIRMTTFTLGTKAPKIDHVRTFPKTEDDIVMMDWKFSFTPNDTLDLTVKQASQKINPKIVLTVKVIKGAGMPILVEDISFVGNIRIRMKLTSNFPHVQIVDISFMEPPQFDYVLKPVGGNTFGFDIGNIPGLSNFIQEQVHANLGPMMYNPNMFTINLEELLSGTPLDTAVGVLQISIWSARNLKGVKLGGGTPDPYAAISIDNKDVLDKTKWKKSTSNPQFKETKFILLNNLNGMLTFSLMDYNDHRPDSTLGHAAWDLKSLEEEAEHENLSSPIMLDGKERGEIQYSLSYYPTLKAEVAEDGTPQPLPETASGVVRLTIHQAKELDKATGLLGDVNPKARLRLNGNKIFESKQMKRTLSPIWEEHKEFLVTNRKRAVVGIEIMNDNRVVSYLSVKLDDLLRAKEKQQDWFPLSNSKHGRVRMSAEWKPVLMSGSMNGGSGYTPAIGVVKCWMKKAIEVKNVEAMMGGKSDPYVRVKQRGQIYDGSTIVNNNLNPEWDEILYCPVHSLNEKVTVEVMDYQNTGKDRSIGTVEVAVSELGVENAADIKTPYSSAGKKSHRDRLHLGRNVYKGEILFDCEFLPGVHLNGVRFKGAGNEAAGKIPDEFDDLEHDEDDVDQEDEDEKDEDSKRRIREMSSKATVAISPTNGDFKEKGHTKNKASVASLASVKTNATTDKDNSGVTIAKEELLQTQSGVLVFNILSGTIAKKNARLEVSFDDAYWPTYTTEKARTEHCTWDEVGEATIKELDWSRMWLKLRTGDDDEDVFAEFQGNTKDVLERALDKEAEFKLASNAGTSTSTVKLTCKYIPTDIHIEPVESVNNQGFLRIDLVSAKNLRGADRGGKSSDPYVVFVLNGERTFKSKTVKKTLNPTFNENLGECQVNSRVAAEAIFEIFDWDTVGTPDKLGQCQVNLGDLEPFQSTEQVLPVTGKGAAENGTLTVRFVFRPEFVASRERKGTSIARTFTQGVGGVGRLGVGGVKGVAGGGMMVGKGGLAVGKAGFGLGKGVIGTVTGRGRNKSLSGGQEVVDGDSTIPEVPPLPQQDENGTPLLVSEGAHEAQGSGTFNDNASAVDSLGTPSKRKSRIHNPFKKH